MRFKSTNALLFSFAALQLNFISPAFLNKLKKSIAGSSSSTKQKAPAAGASEALLDEYWFPRPDHEGEASRLIEADKGTVENSPSEHSSDSTKHVPDEKQLWHDKASWAGAKLNSQMKTFDQRMNSNRLEDQYHSTLVNLEFRRIWKNPNISEDVKQWLDVLAYTIRRQTQTRDHVGVQISVSALYGLDSLELKYTNTKNKHLLVHVRATRAVVNKFLGAIKQDITLAAEDNSPWLKGLSRPLLRINPIISLIDFPRN
ncbi:hypothetical protein PtA15_8A65 [Puccinia triticina]|uniref:Uncharacterized protein n=2 Tax=Puccinia triticina TaxID=208348 RepID=A0ABY7CPH5_9BASI|nr:uncharacterized protein PtA15_8A65 [Puccinia triticina]WAQ87164.1 hypothetical protein PtA15_8A65 [Puccinia triticina]